MTTLTARCKWSGLMVLWGALALGCASSAPKPFVATGPARPALPPDSRITFHLASKPQGPAEQVGIIRVAGSSIMERVYAAQAEARLRGANHIVLLDAEEPSPADGLPVERFRALWVPPQPVAEVEPRDAVTPGRVKKTRPRTRLRRRSPPRTSAL